MMMRLREKTDVYKTNMDDQVTRMEEGTAQENTDTCKFLFKKRVRKQVQSRKREKRDDGGEFLSSGDYSVLLENY